jgi:hypothetical protein
MKDGIWSSNSLLAAADGMACAGCRLVELDTLAEALDSSRRRRHGHSVTNSPTMIPSLAEPNKPKARGANASAARSHRK